MIQIPSEEAYKAAITYLQNKGVLFYGSFTKPFDKKTRNGFYQGLKNICNLDTDTARIVADTVCSFLSYPFVTLNFFETSAERIVFLKTLPLEVAIVVAKSPTKRSVQSNLVAALSLIDSTACHHWTEPIIDTFNHTVWKTLSARSALVEQTQEMREVLLNFVRGLTQKDPRYIEVGIL